MLQGCRDWSLLWCCCECKMWKTAWWFPTKIDMQLQIHTAIVLLGRFPRGMNIYILTKTLAQIFTSTYSWEPKMENTPQISLTIWTAKQAIAHPYPGLQLSSKKGKGIASNLIISWQIDGETMESVTDFIFLGSKITAGGDCSHEIKRCLLLGRKTMTNLDNVLKSRDITLTTKVPVVKAMVFPVIHVWMWQLDHKEGWALKN